MGISVADAIAELSVEGFELSPDRWQRLKTPYGIAMTGKACISERGMCDLRFVLRVEKAFSLERDHDGLAFELACLGYHTVPLPRVHVSGCKRVALMQSAFDRELHRRNDWSGPGFHPRRIPHLAKQLAHSVIPRSVIKRSPRMGALHTALAHLFCILLDAAYNNTSITERSILGVALDAGLHEGDVMPLLPVAANLLNMARPYFLIDGQNRFPKNMLTEPSAEVIQSTLSIMRQFGPLITRITAALGVTLTVDVGLYPEANLRFESADSALTMHYLNTWVYALAYDTLTTPVALARLRGFVADDTDELDSALSSITSIRDTTARLVAGYRGGDERIPNGGHSV